MPGLGSGLPAPSGDERLVKLSLALCLPQDAGTVAVARQVAAGALRAFGADHEVVEELRLALSEACTNVVEHSRADDEYEVRIEIDDNSCEIRVIDAGRGFDYAALEEAAPGSLSPRGRGLAIMRAVVDAVDFESAPEEGTMVHLVKRLR